MGQFQGRAGTILRSSGCFSVGMMMFCLIPWVYAASDYKTGYGLRLWLRLRSLPVLHMAFGVGATNDVSMQIGLGHDTTLVNYPG
jgi:hypothetical protein